MKWQYDIVLTAWRALDKTQRGFNFLHVMTEELFTLEICGITSKAELKWTKNSLWNTNYVLKNYSNCVGNSLRQILILSFCGNEYEVIPFRNIRAFFYEISKNIRIDCLLSKIEEWFL